jgi:hypothetical protein
MVLCVLFALATPAGADEPPDIPVTTVVLQDRPELAKNGKVALYRGEADHKGVAFYIEGLGIATPVGVMLLSGDHAATMNLLVKNDLSKDWDRRVKPDGTISKTQFTTEGPAMVLVTSPTAEAKPYELAIWVGPEVPIHKLLPSPFTNKGGGAASSGGSHAGALIGVAVFVGLLVILVVALKRRAKKGVR